MEAEFDDYLNTAKNLGFELLNSASDMQEKQQKRDLLVERIRQRMEVMSNGRDEAEQRNRELEQAPQTTRDEAWREKTRLQSEIEEEKARARTTTERLKSDHESFASQRKTEHDRIVADLRAQVADERAASSRLAVENESLQRAFDMLSGSVRKFTLGIRDQNDDMKSLLTLVTNRSPGELPALEEIPGGTEAIAGPSVPDDAETRREGADAPRDEIELSLENEDLVPNDDPQPGSEIDPEMEAEMSRIVRFRQS